MSPRRHDGGELSDRTFSHKRKRAQVKTSIATNSKIIERNPRELQLPDKYLPFLAICSKDFLKRSRYETCTQNAMLLRHNPASNVERPHRFLKGEREKIPWLYSGCVTRGRMRSDCLVLSDVAFGQRVVWSLFTGCRQLKPYFRNNYGSVSFRIVFISSCNTLRSLVWLFYNDRRACRGVFSWPSYIWNQDGSHIWSSRGWILRHRCHGT